MTTLEKIRTEIANEKGTFPKEHYIRIIDKYAEQEPCDDAISRQAVLEIAKQHTLTNDYLAIQNLPSVRPQEQTGHWILKRTFPTKLYDEYLNEYKCSECYREIRCTESQLVNYPYCHCGAKMESEV